MRYSPVILCCALAVFVFDQVSKSPVQKLLAMNFCEAEEFGDKFERFWRVEHPAWPGGGVVVTWRFRYAKTRALHLDSYPAATRRGGHHSSWS